MCGRFALHTLVEQLSEVFGVLPPQEALKPRYNIAPSQTVPVIANTSRTELQLFRWGLVPSWAKDTKVGYSLINARAETVAAKPAFRSALRRQRCLLLADGFYEWQKNQTGRKVPHFIRLKSRRPFAMAGLWETWLPPDGGAPVRSCSIITTGPNELMASIHDRMPVILPVDAYDMWLAAGEVKTEELAPLFKSYPADEMEAYPVSTAVNVPKNQGPALIEPAAAGAAGEP